MPLSIHTITHRPWTAEQCIRAFAAKGVGGITLWRHDFEGTSAREIGGLIRSAGLVCTGLARGGFFPALTAEGRQQALDDNRTAIDQARECGAPVLVLVCGAVPGLPLEEARRSITDGIGAVLDHARAAGVRLAIEPLHPVYAADRSAVVTMGQANDICDALGSPPELAIAMDVYHTWWDDRLESEIARAGHAGRLAAFHLCDWRTPAGDVLNDRALMGEGCIPIPRIRRWMTAAGFTGWEEVEIFSTRWWACDQDDYLSRIIAAWRETGGGESA